MDSDRWISFAVFIAVIVVGGYAIWLRRRRAERRGDDPLYGIASLEADPDANEVIGSKARGARPRGE